MIGEVLTAKDLQGYANMNNANYAAQGFVAPTIYRPANGVNGINYYKTLDEALLKYKFLNNIAGGKDVKPLGVQNFKTKAAETIGYNVDFLVFIPNLGLFNIPYVGVRQLMYSSKGKALQCICRYYDTKNKGPFYCILDNRYLAISATDFGKIPEKKRVALNSLHVELQRAKANFNAYSMFIDFWSKRSKNTSQQKIYNQAVALQKKYRDDLIKTKNVDIRFSTGLNSVNGIGVIPVVVVIVAIVAGAVVAAYAIEKITTATKDVKVLNDQNDFQKFQEQFLLQVAKDETAGLITPQQASELTSTAQQAITNSQNIQTEAVKDQPGILQTASKTLLWGGAIFLAYQLIKN